MPPSPLRSQSPGRIYARTLVGAVPRAPLPELTDAFLVQGADMARRLNMSWPGLLLAMNVESGINSHQQNRQGAPSYGLIQIQELDKYGWHAGPDAFMALSPEEQLPYVENYLRDYADDHLDSVERIHQALFLPATLSEGSAPDLVLASATGTRWGGREAGYYADNIAFDTARKGYITPADLRASDVTAARQSPRVQDALNRLAALRPELAAEIQALKSGPLTPYAPSAFAKSAPWLAYAALAVAAVAATSLLRPTLAARYGIRFAWPRVLS